MEKLVNIPGLGNFNEKYQLLSRPMSLNLVGKERKVVIRFNVIDTNGVVSARQIESYKNFIKNIDNINENLSKAIDNLKIQYGIEKDASFNIMSVVFDANNDYILIDTSWDTEGGLAALFDESGKITLIDQDDIL